MERKTLMDKRSRFIFVVHEEDIKKQKSII